MDRRKDSKLGMYKAVKDTLEANTTIITAAAVPILLTFLTDLTDQIQAIIAISHEAEADIKGITLSKADARNAVITSAHYIANIICSSSIITSDIVSKSEMNISLSYLTTQKDEELIPIVKRIHSKAMQLTTPPKDVWMSNFGIGKPDVDALGSLIDNYSQITIAPRSAIIKRKTYNEILNKDFKNTDALLASIDRIMISLKQPYPDFYMQYSKARKLVSPPTAHTRIIGTVTVVTDAGLDTMAVMEGAKITVILQPYLTIKNRQKIQITSLPVTVMTDSDGNYIIPTPDIRTSYTVICKLPGYIDQQQANVRVNRGKGTTVDFILEPVSGEEEREY